MFAMEKQKKRMKIRSTFNTNIVNVGKKKRVAIEATRFVYDILHALITVNFGCSVPCSNHKCIVRNLLANHRSIIGSSLFPNHRVEL